MNHDLVVHGFETSNNLKVRLALGFKGLDYEFRTIDPKDRDEIVRLSGQHLTPVLQHGDRIIFDSAAILRYLEANFRDTPRLFGHSVAEQWQIEDVELMARTRLAGPMMDIVHARVVGKPLDDRRVKRCEDDFAAAVRHLANTLDGAQWLVGDTMTAADITAAAVLFRVRSAELLPLPLEVAQLDAWQERVMAFDGKHRVA